MSFTARSRRNSVTGSTGWPRRQQAPGAEKRPFGPDISRQFAAGPPLHPSIVDAPRRPSTPLPGRHSSKLGQQRTSRRPRPQAAPQVARAPHVQMAIHYPGNCTECPARMSFAIVCSSTWRVERPMAGGNFSQSGGSAGWEHSRSSHKSLHQSTVRTPWCVTVRIIWRLLFTLSGAKFDRPFEPRIWSFAPDLQ